VNTSEARDARLAMGLSLAVGVAMLAGKVGAYVLTGSAAILSDAAESVIHVVAVAFAAFALWLSARPPDRRFPYGYERISFFSAGFEGALIIIAAIVIIVAAIEKWMAGLVFERLGTGTVIVAAASLLNLALGLYLVRTGRRTQSIILEANGKHVLTDSWTSFGVIVGLLLVLVTGWKPFDPLVAIAVAINIIWSGGGLLRRSIAGLLDYSSPELEAPLHEAVTTLASELGLTHHQLRFRFTGQRALADVHLIFDDHMTVGEAHRLATLFERTLPTRVPFDLEVVTHLEAFEDHDAIHADGHVLEPR
jgi:cation diffusion facilitator family transporter